MGAALLVLLSPPILKLTSTGHGLIVLFLSHIVRIWFSTSGGCSFPRSGWVFCGGGMVFARGGGRQAVD